MLPASPLRCCNHHDSHLIRRRGCPAGCALLLARLLSAWVWTSRTLALCCMRRCPTAWRSMCSRLAVAVATAGQPRALHSWTTLIICAFGRLRIVVQPPSMLWSGFWRGCLADQSHQWEEREQEGHVTMEGKMMWQLALAATRRSDTAAVLHHRQSCCTVSTGGSGRAQHDAQRAWLAHACVHACMHTHNHTHYLSDKHTHTIIHTPQRQTHTHTIFLHPSPPPLPPSVNDRALPLGPTCAELDLQEEVLEAVLSFLQAGPGEPYLAALPNAAAVLDVRFHRCACSSSSVTP